MSQLNNFKKTRWEGNPSYYYAMGDWVLPLKNVSKDRRIYHAHLVNSEYYGDKMERVARNTNNKQCFTCGEEVPGLIQAVFMTEGL